MHVGVAGCSATSADHAGVIEMHGDASRRAHAAHTGPPRRSTCSPNSPGRPRLPPPGGSAARRQRPSDARRSSAWPSPTKPHLPGQHMAVGKKLATKRIITGSPCSLSNGRAIRRSASILPTSTALQTDAGVVLRDLALAGTAGRPTVHRQPAQVAVMCATALPRRIGAALKTIVGAAAPGAAAAEALCYESAISAGTITAQNRACRPGRNHGADGCWGKQQPRWSVGRSQRHRGLMPEVAASSRTAQVGRPGE